MKNYTVKEINKKRYVLTPCLRNTQYLDGNYENTGMALAGILKKGQSLETWLINLKEKKTKFTDNTFRKKYFKKRYLKSKIIK